MFFALSYVGDSIGKYFENLEIPKNGERPLILCGPSGAGKSTCIKLLQKAISGRFSVSISHTTRNPRMREKTNEMEENGVEYYFVSKKEFEEGIEKDEFIEHAKVHLNYYGTSEKAVSDIQKEGKVCILDIDVQGVQQVYNKHKSTKKEPFIVFIRAPSRKVLEERLRNRKTDTEKQIQTRLKNAVTELNWADGEGKQIINKTIVTVDKPSSLVKIKEIVKEFYGIV